MTNKIEELYNIIVKKFIPKKLVDNIDLQGSIYIVGGAIRDFLLTGKEPDEVDFFVLGWLPEDLIKLLKRYGSAVFVGSSFGVIKFTSNNETSDVAVPEFRGSNNSIKADLENRDFTINAVAVKIPSLEIFDPANGIRDLKDRIIRQTSDHSFIDDPLRIMRAIRFSVQLGFDIEDKTITALESAVDKFDQVAPERIRDEIEKILTKSDKPSKAFMALHRYGLLKKIMPELDSTFGVPQEGGWHIYDVFEHILNAVDNADKNLVLRLSLLLHDIGKPQCKFIDEDGRAHFNGHGILSGKMAKKRLQNLRFSNEIINSVKTLIDNHMTHLPSTDKGVKRLIRRLSEDLIDQFILHRLCDLQAMDVEQVSDEIDNNILLGEKMREIIDSKAPLSFKDLAVCGDDIMEIFNLPEGRIIGEILNHLLDFVLDNPENNREELLINEARKFLEHCQR